MWNFSSRTFGKNGIGMPGQRWKLGAKVDIAAIEAERLGFTTAILILRMARLAVDRAEPNAIASMPRNNPDGKPYRMPRAGRACKNLYPDLYLDLYPAEFAPYCDVRSDCFEANPDKGRAN
jgi:hypothetical protein